MENYDLFGDDLGSGMLDGLGDLGSNFNNSSNQPNSGAGNMMQSYNNQQPQYTQIGQGMVPPSKMTPGSYPDYSSPQYGQYGAAGQPPSIGGYGSAPTRPMAGYPYPHQPSASPSMHYQDYSSVVQNPGGMIRPPAPTPQHAPAPRMVAPTPQQAQQQFSVSGYRPPGQESMYLQQFPRWNEQQTPSPYGGASSLPHHYPSNSASAYRAPAPPPHAYPSNLPRPPQPIGQQPTPPQPPQQSSQQQQQQQQQPPPPSNSQHNIPYMPRPQPPSVMSQPSQPQYGQSMYPNSTNQYPNYHHASSSVNQLQNPPAVSSSSYPHHTQQQYNLPTPSPQHQYSNQYGQYYPTGSNASLSNQPQGPAPATPMAYPGSYPPHPSTVNSPVPNGTPSYRPPGGYVQIPQLSPRQPTPSPRQLAPSPKPPSSTTPTIPSSTTSISQGQQQSNTQPSQQQQQQQQPSSLQQLEQMVMPHVNNKNSPSPKPQHNNLSSSAGGVLSPMSMSGPKTPMSPGMQGPKTPMSPPQWQSAGTRPPGPPIASKPSYLHPQQQQQQQQLPGSPSSFGGHGGIPNSHSNVDNTINSVARSGQEQADLELSGLSATLDTSAPDTSIPTSVSNEEIKPSTPIPPVPPPHSHEMNGLSSSINDGSKSHSESTLQENQSQASAQSEEQRFSMTNNNSTSNTESPMEGERSGALSSLSSGMDNSHSNMSQYNASPSADPNSISNQQNSHVLSSPSTPLSSSSQNANQSQPDLSSPQYSNSNINNNNNNNMNLNGTSESSHQSSLVGLQQNSQGQAPGHMMGNNNMMGYGSSGAPQQNPPYGNSMGSPQPSMKTLMPPINSHQYPPPQQRFPSDPNGQQQQPYMNNYHAGGMYPGAPYQQPMAGPMRPTGPPQYPMNSLGPQGMQGGPERFGYEMHQMNQQLQHLYSLPPNPQTQVQINELQERLRSLQAMPGSPYPLQPPMGGAPPYGQIMPMGGMPMDIPMDLPENGPSKGKKKKERKPRGDPKEPKPKGKGKGKGKNNFNDATLQPPQLPDEIYEFQDLPPEVPEKKSKKSRKPRDQKSPAKPKKAREPKPVKEKSPPKRSRKKKPEEADESLNASFLDGEPMDGDIVLPKIEDNSESDQKNVIGAAGIPAEGGSSTPSGGDEDTSTQDAAATNDTDAAANPELATTPKPKAKPKKPKLKSSSTGKKRPSKTMLAFKNRKKRRRSDSEASEPERTPPPSPPPEEDSNKRRSGRNTQRKKYVDDIDLALSDEDLLLPSKALTKAIEDSTAEAAAEAKAADPTSAVDGQAEMPVVGATPVAPPTPIKTPTAKDKSKNKTVTEESPNINKHNFFYVNTSEEDTMVVQHILSMRLGKREVVDSSDEEDEADEPKDKTVNELENEKKPEEEEEEGTDKEPTKDVDKDEKDEGISKTTEENSVKSEIPEPITEPNPPEPSRPEEQSKEDSEPQTVAASSETPIEEEVKPETPTETPAPPTNDSEDKTSTSTENPTDMQNTTSLEDVSENKDQVAADSKTAEESTEKETSSEETPVSKNNKKQKESRTIEVEEFYVKYKSFSYLHCEWKTEEELMKGDKRVNQKIKRFKQKLSNNANIFEFIEEDPFNPEYVEVDRVLDMSEVTDPSGKVTKNYLVKWRSLPYDEATWELEDDIDPEKIAQFERFHKCPKKDQWNKKKRPKAPEWVKLDESMHYKNGNSLREYQLEGLNWLSFSWFNGRNCILADEMGLGKTIQSLTFVESVYRYGIRGPFLVIAPLSTVPNWQREFETWTDLNVVVYHGSVASRNMIQEYELFYRHPDNPQMNLKDCYKFNVLITTFEIVLTDVMELKDFPWRVCVIDEAHRLKNKNCKLLEGLRLLNMEHRVLLSGTPLQNNVQELFSLLNFLEPSQFCSDENFVKEFGDLKSETQVQKLQALLKPMMLRRLKEDVEKSIAPKEETIVEVELTNMQKKYYRAILERNFSFLSKGTSSSNIPNLMNTMMELRKCCIHPYLLNGAEEQIQLDYRLNHNLPDCEDQDVYYKALVQSSGKMVLVDKLLAKLKASGHRVLIFSQMVRCLDILEDYLIYRQYPYERLDGRIRGSVRQAAIDRYSKPDSDRFVFLLCTKAGGLGINLTAADTVIIYDSDWNPQNDLQAQARCHRIGQSKKVKIYRLICRNTYEREMFDRASLKLGLDKAVLQSMNTTQGGKIDPNATASKQLTKKEVEDLLKRGAYGALMDEDNAGEKFCEEDIDVILERRTQIITLESGEKGSTFSKASFAATGIREDINIDDPDFWKLWAKKAEIDVDERGDQEKLVLDEPRRRTQIRRYGHDEGVMEISELDSSSDSDEEGNVGDRTRSGKASRKTRSGKGKRGRRGNLDDEYLVDDGVVEYGKWSKSECYKIERGLLTYGWKRWNKILDQGQFRLGWNEHHMEDCARLILLHCVNNFRGDEKVKSFVADLVCPLENANSITRNHSGLANPVSRGGRKSKKKDKLLMMMKSEETFANDDWMRDDRYDTEAHLDPTFIKHLSKNSNKVLLRIRMLYYIKQEIIGNVAAKIDQDLPIAETDVCPPSLVVDIGPVDWWDKNADASLLAGTYKHGYERYNIMRQDPALCFLNRVGPPDGSAVLAEISAEVNEDEMEKDVGVDEEDEESNIEAKEVNTDKEKDPTETDENKTEVKAAEKVETNEDEKGEPKEGEPTSTTSEEVPKPESTEPDKPIWPGTTDMNTRIRKLITAFQRYFKKEELKNAQKAKRMERKEKIDQIVRERERQKMEVHQKRWSKKEEADFYRAISTFGVQRIEKNKFDWSKFRAISRLDKKFDETLTEYYRAFYAMCKRICGQKLSEEEDLIQVPVDPLPEDRARRTLDRIDLLNKIRAEIIHHDKLDERLQLCLPSLDMPEWWIPGKHDRDLLYGAARHGLGRTELFYVNDPELSFREILRRHMAGEPLLDPAEKAAYKNPDKKVKSESEPPPLKRIRPDMVDIEIKDLKSEIENEKRKKEAADILSKSQDADKSEEQLDLETPKDKDSITCEGEKEASETAKESEQNTTEKEEPAVIKIENPDEEVQENGENKNEEEQKEKDEQKSPIVKQEPMEVDEKEPTEGEISNKDVQVETVVSNDKNEEDANGKVESPISLVVEKEKQVQEGVKKSVENEQPIVDKPKELEKPETLEEKDKITNEAEDSKGSSMEMNEVQVEIKNELKITIKLPAEKMNRVEVQVKGSPKFSMPEPPPTSSTPVVAEKEEIVTKPSLPKFDPFTQSESNCVEALLNASNPIRWPRDRAIQIRLEHIVHAVEKNEWPVSRFFSSAAMAETFEYTPQGTPETATPVRDTPTPISECSDLAPPEDLIMSLPSNSTPTSMVSSTTITPVPVPGRRGRRRKIAIDVETERAKLQALLSQTMHQSNILSHLPNNPRLNSALRRERGERNSTKGLNLSHDTEKELDSRLSHMTIPNPSIGKSSKFQPPPPAHQHHSLSGTAASLLRNSHQQQQSSQQHRRSRSPITRRGSPGFSSQAQSSTLDLSIKSSSHKDVAAAAMSALSSLSSVTVTPVTLPSPSSKSSRDRNRDSSGIGSGGLTISSSPMDLSGGMSKRSRESSSIPQQDVPLNFGSSGPPKKVSKLENMLDKLKKRKLGDTPDSSEPVPVEKDKKKRKLDEIVFGLSAAKGSNVFSPPHIPEKRSGAANFSHLNSSQGVRNSSSSPQVSSHSGARSGTPSPAMPTPSKEAQAFAQNFLSNPLLSALSMFNAKDLKDLKDFSRFAATMQQATKKDSTRASGNTPSPGASQTPEMPKCDLSRLAEVAVPKFDLFSQDAKVNKWLAEHANMTPERPPSPEFVDRRRRRPRTDPLMMDWNKLNGEENVPVIHRTNGKKITGPKAPQLKHLAQWLLENPGYDVDPRWAELVKERGNLPTDLQKRLQAEKKKGPGRPPTVTSPSPPTPTSSANTPSVPTSSAHNAFSNLGAFSNLPGLSGINPSLLASFGALDPKNPLFMPFGGLGSLGNLSSLGNLANLGSLSGMGNLGLPNNLFGLGSPFMNFGQDLTGLPSNSTGDKGSNGKDGQQSSSNSRTPTSSQSKKEDKSKKSASSAAAQAQQNLLSSSLPFLFPNPGLMYNPLGLGSFPGMGGSGSPFGNLGQGSMLNGLGGDGSSSNKKSSASGSKSNNANNNPLLAAGLAGLNLPSLSKKDLKDLAAMSSSHANLLKQPERSKGERRTSTPSNKDAPSIASLAAMSQSQPMQADDSDDESLKSLMGNHQDDLPDDDFTPENAERIVLKESKELEKEMAQQKMETRREKRLRDREDRGGLTSAERQLLMEKKKERLAKEDEPTRESSGRTTRRSAANRNRLEDTVSKLKEVDDCEEDDSPEKS